MSFWSKIGSKLYGMLSSDNSDTLSNVRVQSFVLFCIGLILLICYYCGLGVNVEVAYAMVGIGSTEGTIKSVTSVLANRDKEQTED